MALHRLTSIAIGVPNLAECAQYYREFGLTPVGEPNEARFSTHDGGEQLRLVESARRRLVELGIGVDDPADLERISTSLARIGVASECRGGALEATDPGTRVRVIVRHAPRLLQSEPKRPVVNAPGRAERRNQRAEAIVRDAMVRPRKLGHVVLGSTALEASERFFIEGIGFKVSDRVAGLASFLRCSTDHHNLLVQGAPVPLLHHTSWQVDDVDEIGRAAQAMLAKDPSRHVWGLGRHHIGSNYFWYLKDPAGNFTEYYADLDCIVDDEIWKPGVWEGMKALMSWGPPVPGSFLAPDDLAELMAGAQT